MSVKVLKTEEFDRLILNGEGVSVIDFFATWCGPCKMLGPVVEQVSEELPEVKFYKVDVDEDENLALQYKIMNVPTLAVFKNGELVNKSVGVISAEAIKKLVDC